MTVSIWQDAGAGARRRCDVAVVGAGLVGCYLAWRLRESGVRTLLLEARTVAAGASGRNAGMLLMGLADPYALAVQRLGREVARAAWAMTCANRERTLGLARALGVPSQRPGSLLLAGDAAEAEELAESAARLREDGFACEQLPHDPTARGWRAALLQPEDATVDPVALTTAVAAASGVELLEECEVFAIEAGEGGVRLRARRAEVECRQAVLALNGYAALLDPWFAGRVLPRRAQMLATAPLAPLVPIPAYAERGYVYFRQRPDGALLVGGYRHHFLDSEVGWEDRTTPELQALLERLLAERFPEARATVTHRWSGVMGFTADGLPLVGSLPHLPAVGFAAGFSGHGLGIGLEAAEALLALLLRQEPAGILDAGRLPSPLRKAPVEPCALPHEGGGEQGRRISAPGSAGAGNCPGAGAARAAPRAAALPRRSKQGCGAG